jgi:hypothetical protein
MGTPERGEGVSPWGSRGGLRFTPLLKLTYSSDLHPNVTLDRIIISKISLSVSYKVSR